MRRLHVLAALAFIAGCTSELIPTSVPETTQREIVNGTADPEALDLTEGQQQAIGYLHPRGRSGGNFCTGTFITGQHVATASHCTQGSSATEIGFSTGQNPRSPEATFDVAQIWNHPSVDAAILVLSEDATESLPDLVPIPHNTVDIPNSIVGEPVQAGGFGDTRGTNSNGRWFATVYMLQVRNSEIVVDGRGQQGICYGDSGSGVIADLGDGPVVLGVESWGDDSCVGEDHLTRLDRLDDWITSIINGEVPEDPCQGLDFLGRCNEEVAEWCSRGEFRTRDCGAVGSTCELINDRIGYACACPEGLTYQGRCSQNVIEYCDDDNGFFREINCAAQGGFCVWQDDDTGYVCGEEAPSCSPADAAGRCDGDVLIGCDTGQTTRIDCARDGAECVSSGDGAECVGGGGDDVGVGEDVGTGDDVGGGDDVGSDDSGDGSDAGTDDDVTFDGSMDDSGDGEGSGAERPGGTSSGCSTAPSSAPSAPWIAIVGLAAWILRRRR